MGRRNKVSKILLDVMVLLTMLLWCKCAVLPPTMTIDFLKNVSLANGNVTKMVPDRQGNIVLHHQNGLILRYNSNFLSYINLTPLLTNMSYSFANLQYVLYDQNNTLQSFSVSNLVITDGLTLNSFDYRNQTLLYIFNLPSPLLDYYTIPFETMIYITIDPDGVKGYFGPHIVTMLVSNCSIDMASFIQTKFHYNYTTDNISITANSILACGDKMYYLNVGIITDRNLMTINQSTTYGLKHTFASNITKIVVLSYAVILQTTLYQLLAWNIYSLTPITLSPLLTLNNTILLSSYLNNLEPFLLFDNFTALLDITTNSNSFTVLATFQGQWNFALSNIYGYAVLLGTALVFNLNYCYNMHSYSLINHTCTPAVCSMSNCHFCAYLDSCNNCAPGYSLISINGTCLKNICSDPLCLLCQANKLTCLYCTVGSLLLPNSTCFIPPLTGTSISIAQGCNYFSDPTYISNCKMFLESGNIASFATFNQIMISIPSMNLIAMFAAPFLEFNSDYWYYLYHNRNISNLYYTSIFFQFMTAINSGRLVPFFIQQAYVNSLYDEVITEYFHNTYQNYTNPKVIELDQSGVYFLESMRDMLIWNYSGSILLLGGFFILLKMLTLCFHITRATPLKYSLATYLWDQSRLLNLFKMLVEANSIFIMFYCGQQLKMMFAFDFSNKVNMVLCLIFLFGTIFSSITFYVLVYALNRREARLYLQEKKHCRGSYFNETVVMSLRFCVSGFLQGTLLTEYAFLLGGMAMLKAVVIISQLVNRKCYEVTISWFLQLLYFFFGMGYDLFLFLTYVASPDSPLAIILQTNSIYFQGLFILGFIAAASAALVVNLFKLITETFSFIKKMIVKSNKVAVKKIEKPVYASEKEEETRKRLAITEPYSLKRPKMVNSKETFKNCINRRNARTKGKFI